MNVPNTSPLNLYRFVQLRGAMSPDCPQTSVDQRPQLRTNERQEVTGGH